MKYYFYLMFFVAFVSEAQNNISFQTAYTANSYVPEGILEAVAFTHTHIRNVSQTETTSCSGMPLPYGVMGVFDNGANYFRENGLTIANLSGITIEQQKQSVELQIMAYAKAFDFIMQTKCASVQEKNNPENICSVLLELSAIPDSGGVNIYTRDAELYEILRFMNLPDHAQTYQFPVRHFNLAAIFGANYPVLSAQRVTLSENGIHSGTNHYQLSASKSTQYGPATWNAAPTCNYSSRNGTAISAITIHTIQGTYAGAISWAQNCSSSVSYHYVIRSSDGQVTQMVLEDDKAWHVGSENPYTIGYEHEGYIDDSTWYTQIMYESSADLSRDIVNSGYGIPALRTFYGAATTGINVLGNCTKIKGHQHYPNQTHTDPGIYWNWEKYYRLINNNPAITTVTAATGNFYDSGGASGDYTDDERLLWLFQPANASSVTLNFSSFFLESGYDYLFIYDGSSINAPLIGNYTGTNSPGTITSSSGSILVEFRSDCGTTSTGWAATISSALNDVIAPQTAIVAGASWQTQDFTVAFNDSDNEAIEQQFYLAADKYAGQTGWKANGPSGFLQEDFADDANSWTEQTGSFTLSNGAFLFNDASQNNSNAYAYVAQVSGTDYLYEWKQTITSSGSNQRAGLHFFCDDPTLSNRGNSYFVYLRQGQNKAQIYKVVNDSYTLETNDTCVIDQNTEYTCRVWYSPSSGWIKLFIDGNLVSSWQDATPIQNGNSVSLRSGGCTVVFDDIQCYKSRGNTSNIQLQQDFRYQSDNAQAAGLIRSTVIDASDNWSAVAEENYLVDWSAPVISWINDGVASDLDTTYSTTLEANWQSEDIHSGISQFEVAIGTTPGATDITSWTTTGTTAAFSQLLANQVYDQVYYMTVRAQNNAGLIDTLTSDGQLLLEPPTTAGVDALNLETMLIYPNPAKEQLHIQSGKPISYYLYANDGELLLEGNTVFSGTIRLPELASGVYLLMVKSGQAIVIKKVEVQQ